MALKDSKTEQNLKDAFAGESQANRRYLYFAAKADVEGYNDVAAVFRCLSFGAGKLDFLSMASTVRWKRRKRASARTRVDSRSIVVESSLTVLC